MQTTKNLWRIALTTVLIAFWTTAPHAMEKMKIVVLPFENNLKKSTDASIGEAASQAFQDQLLESGGFRLVERKQINKVLKELAFSQAMYADPDHALKLGKILSARYMVIGKVIKGTIHKSGVDYDGNEQTWAAVSVSSSVLEVESGEVIFSKKSERESRRYENWGGNTYHALVVEAVETATSTLASQFVETIER